MAKTYDYTELQNAIMSEIQDAVMQGEQKGIEQALSKKIQLKLTKKNINIDTSNIQEIIQDAINGNLNADNFKIKNISHIDLNKLIKLDNDNFQKEFQKIYEEAVNSVDNTQASKKLIGAIEVAKFKNIKLPSIIDERTITGLKGQVKNSEKLIDNIQKELNKSANNAVLYDSLIESTRELNIEENKIVAENKSVSSSSEKKQKTVSKETQKIKENTKALKENNEVKEKNKYSDSIKEIENAWYNKSDFLNSKSKKELESALKELGFTAKEYGQIAGDHYSNAFENAIANNKKLLDVVGKHLGDILSESTRSQLWGIKSIDESDDSVVKDESIKINKTTEAIEKQTAAQKELNKSVEETNKNGISSESAENVKYTDEQVKNLSSDLKELFTQMKNSDTEIDALIGTKGISTEKSPYKDRIESEKAYKNHVNNLNNDIYAHFHNHPAGTNIISGEDLSAYYDNSGFIENGLNTQGLVEGDNVQIIDFSGLDKNIVTQFSQEWLDASNEIKSSLSPLLSDDEWKQQFDSLRSAKWSELIEKYGLSDRNKNFSIDDTDNIAKYLLEIKSNAGEALSPVQQLINLIEYGAEKKLDLSDSGIKEILDLFSSGNLTGAQAFDKLMIKLGEDFHNLSTEDEIAKLRKLAEETFGTTPYQGERGDVFLEYEEKQIEELGMTAEETFALIKKERSDLFSQPNKSKISSGAASVISLEEENKNLDKNISELDQKKSLLQEIFKLYKENVALDNKNQSNELSKYFDYLTGQFNLDGKNNRISDNDWDGLNKYVTGIKNSTNTRKWNNLLNNTSLESLQTVLSSAGTIIEQDNKTNISSTGPETKSDTVSSIEAQTEALRKQADAQEQVNKTKAEEPKINESAAVSDIENKTEAIKEQVTTQEKLNQIESQPSSSTTQSVETLNEENKISNELLQKLIKIKSLAENGFSVLDPESFDEDILDELNDSLFSLTNNDLISLQSMVQDGFDKKSVDVFLDALDEVQQKMQELTEDRYVFENGGFGDEDDVSYENIDEMYSKVGRVEGVGDRIKDSIDDAGIAVDLLIQKIVDMDEVSNGDTTSKKSKNQITQQQKTVKSTEAVVKAQQQEIETQNEVADAETREEKTAKSFIVSKKNLKKATEEVTKANIEDVNSSKAEERSYESLTKKVEELTEVQNEYYNQIEELYNSKANQARYSYNSKLEKYGKLSDEELRNKYIEKVTEGQSQTALSSPEKIMRKWTSAFALAKEYKDRFNEEINLSDFAFDGEDFEKNINLYGQAISNGFDSVLSDLESKHLEANKQVVAAQQDLDSYMKNELTDLEKAEIKYTELLNKIYKSDGTINQSKTRVGKDGTNTNLDALIKTYSQIKGLTLAEGKEFDASKYVTPDLAKLMNEYTDNVYKISEARRQLYEQQQQEKKQQQALNTEVQKTEENLSEVADAQQKTAAATNEQVDASKSMSQVSSAFSEEATGVKDATTKESTYLTDLCGDIDNVIAKVNEKTQRFEIEANTVNESVGREREDLQRLITKLEEVKSALLEINGLGINIDVKTGNLKSLLNSANDGAGEKLNVLSKALEGFAKAVNEIDIKADAFSPINDLLSQSDKFKDLATILNASQKDIDKATSAAEGGSSSKKSSTEYIDALKQLTSTEEKYQKLTNKKSLTNKEAGELAKLTTQRERSNEVLKHQTVLTEEEAAAQKKYLQTVQDVSSYMKAYNSNDTFDADTQADIDALSAKAAKYSAEYQERLTLIKSLFDQVNGKDLDLVDPNDVAEIKAEREEVTRLIDDLKTNGNDFKLIDKLSKAKLTDKISKWLDKYDGASDSVKQSLKDIIAQIETVNDAQGLKTLNKQFLDITKNARESGQEIKSVLSGIKGQIKHQFEQQIARYFSFQDIIRYIKVISDEIITLDSSLTELRKVSNATEDRLAQSFQKSAETAKELGSTISDVIDITADWSRLGYSVDDAEELARVTTLFKTVGDDMTADDASSYLVSTLQGFQMDASEAEDIVDKFNEVANNYAIDTAGIGEALQRSAASFNAAHTDLNKSIALITATNEVVQDPESVGTLWKTMSARIRGASTELEDLGEEEDEYTKTTSKLRDLIQSMTGFDIMEDENNFKDIYDIILGISKEWNNLTDVEQASLGEALAGFQEPEIYRNIYLRTYLIAGNTLEISTTIIEKSDYDGLKTEILVVLQRSTLTLYIQTYVISRG